ncbi:MAG: adenylate/guanylate cyclase domain-containing protein [Rhodothermaceae bacterium]|nr:adenylate/guanylate cyclase domain-containing protein [Rhodothermaceae bacterium]
MSEQSDREIREKYPWPTDLYARLINNLNQAGARTIGIDVIFDQMDIYNPRNDTIFANAIRTHGNVVLAGKVHTEYQRSRDEDQVSMVEMRSLVEPLPVLRNRNANPWGFVTAELDMDGFIRRYRLVQEHLGENYLAFALQVMLADQSLENAETIRSENTLRVGPFSVPLYLNETMLINYYGGPTGTFPEFDFDQVIDDDSYMTVSEQEIFEINTFDDPEYGLLHQGVFRDKIVLVGATMPELQDYFSTPFAPFRNMPGYQTHANAIQTILDKSFIYSLGENFELFILILFAVSVVFISLYTSALWGLLAVFLHVSGYTSLVIFMFIEHSVLLPVTGPLLTIVVGYLISVIYNYVTEQREKGRIKLMFGSYVSPELVNIIIDSGDDPKLGGEESVITAFFSDIQNFASFSEKLNPTQLVDLINEYMTAMTEILTEERGTLDKYLGDAIVAFFGAPVHMPDHALKACITSQRMQKKQRELKEKWKSEGKKWPEVVTHMQTRIGLNTGLVITGNMGSSTRFNYTMMGDNVNLAARCETACKSYGVYTIATEDTKTEAEKYGNDCVFRLLDKIVVVGRTKPVTVYEIVGLRSDANAKTLRCVRLFEMALNEYYGQNFNDAHELFRQSARLEPNQLEMPGVYTNPSLIFLDRCEKMLQNPPDPDWDGVFVMSRK